MANNILIVDDEIDLAAILAYNLQADGFRTRVAHTAADALKEARREPPDLLILDLMLPDAPGTEVCKQLKSDPRTRDIPVLMLTARGEEIDRVVGFELGAEDYVVKPFSVRELVLRVKALLRRSERPPDAAERYSVGVLQVDVPRHRVTVSGEEIHLTALEFKLLVTLMTRRGRVQTREGLLDEVWGITAEVTTRTVDTHVKRLREKLGEVAADYVETLRGVGYRFRDSAELSD